MDTGGLTAEALARVTVIAGPTCDAGLCPDGGVVPPDDDGGGCGCQGSGSGTPLAGPWIVLLWLSRRRRR